jgi:glycosyltransferase involved in cell wall biosynthesis
VTDTAMQQAPSEAAAVPSIRVAHVAELSERSASGVDRTVAGLVTHLERFGVMPEVWYVSNRYTSVQERRSGSVRVFELPAHPRMRSAVSRLPGSTRRFIRERRHQIDMLHLHSVFIPDNVWVAREARLPYVITPHGGYAAEVIHGRNWAAKTLWMRMVERKYVGNASLIHAVSPRELDELRARFRARSFVYAPNAIDLPTTPVAPAERLLGSPRRVVFLGRLAVAHKGLDLLLEGYARCVRSQTDADVELIVAGPDFRSGRMRLEALAASLLPGDGPRFMGAVFGEDKDALMTSAYVFVHTSRWEGMPYAVLEALATGCPVLITPATNLAGFVEEYGAGLVVEGTAEAISEGLKRLLDLPPDEFGQMCSAARRLAEDRFTWPAVAEQMSAAYRTILG